jgi:hypothetical protein
MLAFTVATYRKILLTELNPLNAELNPIRHLLALAVAHHFVHVSRVRVKFITRVTRYKKQAVVLFFKHGDCSRLKQKYIRVNLHSFTLFIVYALSEVVLAC